MKKKFVFLKRYSFFCFHLIASVVLYFLTSHIVEVLGNLYEITPILLVGVYFLGGIFLFQKRYALTFVAYLAGIFIFLLFRIRYEVVRFSFDNYLYKWWKLMFKNEVVFYNILGNIILFIPLFFFLDYFIKRRIIYNLILSLLIIVLFELLQLIFHRGIFDIVDIFLNMFGVLIGAIFYNTIIEVKTWIKMKKSPRRKKMIKKSQ